MRENFEFKMFYDPVGFFTDILMGLISFIIKVVLFGYIIYYTMKKTDLIEDRSIQNYVKYLVIASIIMYIVSIFNMVYDCYREGTEVQKMSFSSFAKSSTFVFIFILVHVIALFVCSKLRFAPVAGIIVNQLAWGTMWIVLIIGAVYTITYESVKLAIGCPQSE